METHAFEASQIVEQCTQGMEVKYDEYMTNRKKDV